MKKFLSLILSFFLALSLLSFSACKKEEGNLTFYVPDGAPALSISKFILDGENFNLDRKVEYNVVTSSEISAAVTVKKADFVILPLNLATKVYNANEEYRAVSVITHGNFYFVSSFNISSVQDIVGKVICLPNAKNTVPDLTLKVILENNGILYEEGENAISGKVVISYFADGVSVIAKLPASGSDSLIGLLPEPAATNIKNKKSVYSYSFDMQQAYDSQNKSYPQAVLLAKKSTLDKYPDILTVMKEKFNLNISWVKDNPQSAVSSVKDVFGASSLSSLTTTSIENCKIYWKDIQEEREGIITYINKIRNISNTCANVVDDGFFI